MRPRIIRKNPAAMPVLPSRALAAAVATGLAASSGCGEPAPVAVDASPLRLTLSEYRVAPQAVRVPAGRTEVVVRNGGTTVHRLEIRSADGMRTFASSPPLRPRQTARLAVELPRGTYVETCAVERHDTLGEHGTIVAR
jgi:Cupredoxin-like domain